MRERVLRALAALVGLAVFVAALEVLRRELHAVTWRTLSADVLRLSPAALALAILLTVANYLVLTGYDFIALAYVRRRIRWTRVVAASFLAYAVSNNVGFAMLSGTTVRYRFYTRWGVTADELSRIVLSYSITFWSGLLVLGGGSLAIGPLAHDLNLPGVRLLGWGFMAIAATYVAATAVRRTPVRIGRFLIPLPAFRLAVAQVIVSALDWALAGSVLYVLLPPGLAPPTVVLAAFLAAQLLGLASNVPGGVGVFEGLMVLMLAPYASSADVLPALLVYRVVYYLLPLGVALVGLVSDELHVRRSQAARAGAALGRLAELLAPHVLAVFIFLGGVVLLFSGSTPAAAGRLARLGRIVPLGVVETSHFVGSLVGALLLLLSQAVGRRLDAAFYLTSGALAVGIVASLLTGTGYGAALLLGALLLVVLRARPAFDRRAALFATRFSWSWVAAVIAALASSIWLGLFAFKNVQFSSELWWQFELHGEASRFLRASVGAVTVVLLFALARLFRHAPHEIELPTDPDLEAAGRAIEQQTSTTPYLVYLRDKAVVFDEERTGFVMYGVQGRTWAAMGDPVGPEDRIPTLIRAFLERCDEFGGRPVFYEIRKDYLHHYADFGLAFVKIGEDARVDLPAFRLDGGRARGLRQALARLAKERAVFRVAPAAEVPSLAGALREVSDDWLAHRATAEKGFSLGFFDESYLARFPTALVERDGRVEAFATLWPGPGKVELSLDLMRHRHDAPANVMESLTVHLIRWGQAEGYRWLSLGMAPMSGFEQSPVAPLWTRAGSFLYSHGGRLYNFQGLRTFKEKFGPIWDPHYLAYPGGLTLPRILADVSAIVAGGYRRILTRG